MKFHTIARYQLAAIFKKCKPQSELGAVDAALPGVPTAPTAPGPSPSPAPVPAPAPPPPPPPTPATPVTPAPVPPFEKQGEKDKEDKQTFQVTDCRSLVKTLVCGVKTITWGITSCKAPGGNLLFSVSTDDSVHGVGLHFGHLMCCFFSRSSVHSQQAVTAQRDSDLYKTCQVCDAGFGHLSGKEAPSSGSRQREKAA